MTVLSTSRVSDLLTHCVNLGKLFTQPSKRPELSGFRSVNTGTVLKQCRCLEWFGIERDFKIASRVERNETLVFAGVIGVL